MQTIMYKDAIQKLKAIDLSKYPEQEIKSLLNQFGQFGVVRMDLHAGKTLIRARPNKPGETFSERKELSYLPAHLNKKYQRASTPNQTMFYAGTIPEEVKDGELKHGRVIATLEATELLRTNMPDGEHKLTFSKWVVTKDIKLLAICYNQDFTKQSSHTKELYEAYHQWVKSLPDDLKQKSIEITEFLAQEFAKKNINGDYDYMIPAIFTEKSISKGLDGVYYPSIRVNADGFNVAIMPSVVDSSLKLIVAGECTMYKKGMRIFVDNETVCEIDDDTKPFILKPVDPQYHIGKDKIMEDLNKA